MSGSEEFEQTNNQLGVAFLNNQTKVDKDKQKTGK